MNPAGGQTTLQRDWFQQVTADHDTVQLFIGFSLFVVLIGIVVAGRTIRAVARERTKREIAAYIAEGTMTPEQGERLFKSNSRDCG